VWKFVKKRWQFIVGPAVVLIVLVLVTGQDSGANGSLSCAMEVTANTLNVRSGPGTDNPVVDTLSAGAVVQAERTTSNGFRQLGPNRWAAQRYLDLTPGSNCN
jgi:uncharacterized protein YraI